jgi:hypothetical protein
MTYISAGNSSVLWDLAAVAAYNREAKRTGVGDMGLGGKIPPWLILLGFLLAGIVLISVPHFLDWRWDFGITPEIGIALLVAAILGFTIDRWLKAELRTDAFLAAIGHVLAPEFRAEVSRIVGYKLICERHISLTEIELAGDNVVKVTSSVQRTIRNKSAYPQPIKNYVHIDEWGYAVGRSEILECVLVLEGHTLAAANPPTVHTYSLEVSTEERQLKPDQTVVFRTRWIEYKNINDQLFFHYTIPTLDPEVEVKGPPEIEADIGFGTPVQNVEEFHYAMRRRLVGTYFPHQSISVRWWPKPPPPNPA